MHSVADSVWALVEICANHRKCMSLNTAVLPSVTVVRIMRPHIMAKYIIMTGSHCGMLGMQCYGQLWFISGSSALM